MGLEGFKGKIACNGQEIKDFLQRHKELRKRGLERAQSSQREVHKIK